MQSSLGSIWVKCLRRHSVYSFEAKWTAFFWIIMGETYVVDELSLQWNKNKKEPYVKQLIPAACKSVCILQNCTVCFTTRLCSIKGLSLLKGGSWAEARQKVLVLSIYQQCFSLTLNELKNTKHTKHKYKGSLKAKKRLVIRSKSWKCCL